MTMATSPFPGFYDGVKDLPPDILAQWKKLDLTPDVLSQARSVFRFRPAKTDRLLIEQISSRPTCDINGIIGGYTRRGLQDGDPGGSLRQGLVPAGGGATARQDRDAFRHYVTARLPGDCTADFIDHSNAPAIALDWNMKPLAATKRALTDEWGKEALLIGSGASIPIVADFKRTLGVSTPCWWGSVSTTTTFTRRTRNTT